MTAGRAKTITGKCPSCGYRYPLRKDGRLISHQIAYNTPCSGSGVEPEVAEEPAARAETTTALPRPGDGCQCTWHNEDRGGGHYELVAEYEPACPEHSEHVWNPRTGMWEHRAETTTATTEDTVTEAARLIDSCIPDDVPGYRYRYAEQAAQAMASRGLLATDRTRPTREAIEEAIKRAYYSARHRDMFSDAADAVLALLEGGDDQ